MPERITLTSSRLEKFSRGRKGGSSTWACPWNAKVAAAMNWPDTIHQSETGADLEGLLNAETCEVSPSKSELKKHALELAGATVKAFETVRREIEGKKDKGYRTELRYKITFTDPNGMKKLEQWWNSVGEEKGSVTVSYVKQTELQLNSEAVAATSPAADATFQ